MVHGNNLKTTKNPNVQLQTHISYHLIIPLPSYTLPIHARFLKKNSLVLRHIWDYENMSKVDSHV